MKSGIHEMYLNEVKCIRCGIFKIPHIRVSLDPQFEHKYMLNNPCKKEGIKATVYENKVEIKWTAQEYFDSNCCTSKL